ncbi:hypothetical protein ACXN5S_02595 [Pseudoroseicyclus sp. H15]
MYDPEPETEFDVFTDLLFNSLVAITFMFFLAFAMINPIAETGKIDPKAEFLITVTWPDNSEDDVDTYVEDPAGNIVWYTRREAGLMHLDRDDRGMYRDVILVNGEEIANPLNQESVSIRGKADGEYVVNVVHFISNGGPIPVSVKVEKLNPEVQVIYYETLTLDHTGQEETAVRFTMQGDEVVDVNNRPRSLVELTRQGGNTPEAAPVIDSGSGALNGASSGGGTGSGDANK